VFGVTAEEGGLRVQTTDGKLARAIGEALHHAYRGVLEQPQPQSEGVVRVHWVRD
jgi:hypothetical protein